MANDSESLSPETFKPLLKKLITHPDSFTAQDTRSAFEHLLSSDPDSGSPSCTPAQIGSFLTALQLTGVDRKSEILAAAAGVLKKWCKELEVERGDGLIADIVGTGGDGHDTFNVSTSAAIVAAGAGLRVCKHGNRAATSTSGSADLLTAFGCTFTRPFERIPLTGDGTLPFTFLLATHYHHLLAPLAPIRKSLPFRSILNLLGPLANPARPDVMILGVPRRDLGRVFAEALRNEGGDGDGGSGGIKRALVVCGMEGLDEISCAGGTWIWEVNCKPGTGQNQPIVESSIHPSDFGLPVHPLEVVKGGSPKENAAILERLIEPGTDEDEEEPIPGLEPIRDFVLMNASALLVVGGVAKDYKEGVRMARESCRNGRAWDALVKFRDADASLA